MTPQFIIRLLSLLTLFANISTLIFIGLFLLSKAGFLTKVWKKIMQVLMPRLTLLTFIISLVATSGSLYLSEIAHFEPCKLCWYQRIFMYPLPIILMIAIHKKLKDVWQYVLPLSIIGGLIAIYHYYLQISPEALAPCSTTGFSVSCSERFFTYFGYITIPWMSFSIFVVISLFMFLERNKSRR